MLAESFLMLFIYKYIASRSKNLGKCINYSQKNKVLMSLH